MEWLFSSGAIRLDQTRTATAMHEHSALQGLVQVSNLQIYGRILADVIGAS
jgi:hypothetical protein